MTTYMIPAQIIMDMAETCKETMFDRIRKLFEVQGFQYGPYDYHGGKLVPHFKSWIDKETGDMLQEYTGHGTLFTSTDTKVIEI